MFILPSLYLGRPNPSGSPQEIFIVATPAKHPPRQGAAAVELAIVLPILVLFILGMIEMGQAMSVRQSLLDTARGACRLATLDSTTPQQVTDHINNSMSVAGVSSFSATVLPSPLTSASKGQLVSVQITSNFTDISWLPLPKHLSGVTLSGACSLPHE